uniref:G domain-containing protein n=1 Tax=Haemonchus contortus TaxID=6289 RepID=A0A7I4Z1W4_HAECO
RYLFNRSSVPHQRFMSLKYLENELIRRSFYQFCNSARCTTTSAGSSGNAVPNFREEYVLPPSFDYRVWFPMHMSVQMKKMEGKLRSVDLIVEVHDARIPASGRNSTFLKQLCSVRPHVLVMNKMDLINMKKYKQPIEDYYRYEQGITQIIWTDCKRRLGRALSNVQKAVLDVLTREPRFNRTVKTEFQIMVVGIPNVGKSSLINTWRSHNLGTKQSAVAEGARPGVTVRVQNRVRVLDKPPIYVLDTPGVLSPSTRNVHEAMKLALCNLILESATNPRYVADYLLYWLNRTGDYSYINHLGISGEPTDDIDKLLLRICSAKDLRTRCLTGLTYEERWDFDRAITMFIQLFRKGVIKDCCLDKELLRPYM